MSEIEEIRKRDRETVLGPPGPLFQAEMDRRWLLAEIEKCEAYGADLIRQRAAHDIERTKAEVQVEDLQRQLAEAVGQTEAAKQATREIMAERNTWARQLADMRDERDTARKAVETVAEMRLETENNHSNMVIAIEREIGLLMQSAELGAAYLKGPLQDWGRRIWRVVETHEN